MMTLDQLMERCIPEPNSGCWLWLGSTFKERARTKAYGRLNDELAHRASWRLHRGSPGSALVCHTCDNVACVNPDHLYLGSNKTNSDDKVKRGRQSRGASIRPTKLNEQRVRYIRAHMETPNGILARELGVSGSVIWNVKRGLSWGWVL